MNEPDEPMCPNCVTPWKCNGPHISTDPDEHDPEPLYVPICEICGRDIHFDDEVRKWFHS